MHVGQRECPDAFEESRDDGDVALSIGVGTLRRLQDFAEVVPRLEQAAPELEFAFRVTITAEGERPGREVLGALNGLLGKVRAYFILES